MYLDICYVYIHSKNYESRNIKVVVVVDVDLL
jgi:hypothetical protein